MDTKDTLYGIAAFAGIAIAMRLSEGNPPEWLVRSLILGAFLGLVGGVGMWLRRKR